MIKYFLVIKKVIMVENKTEKRSMYTNDRRDTFISKTNNSIIKSRKDNLRDKLLIRIPVNRYAACCITLKWIRNERKKEVIM